MSTVYFPVFEASGEEAAQHIAHIDAHGYDAFLVYLKNAGIEMDPGGDVADKRPWGRAIARFGRLDARTYAIVHDLRHPPTVNVYLRHFTHEAEL